MRVTPRECRAAYSFLRETLPFRRWKLPDADDLEFNITRVHSPMGVTISEGRRSIRIEISEKCHTHTATLLRTMGHEMIHVYENRLGIRSEHGKHFKRCQKLFAKHHGFDPGDC